MPSDHKTADLERFMPLSKGVRVDHMPQGEKTVIFKVCFSTVAEPTRVSEVVHEG